MKINVTNDLVDWLGLPRFLTPNFATSKRATVTADTPPRLPHLKNGCTPCYCSLQSNDCTKLLNQSGIFDDNDDNDYDFSKKSKTNYVDDAFVTLNEYTDCEQSVGNGRVVCAFCCVCGPCLSLANT